MSPQTLPPGVTIKVIATSSVKLTLATTLGFAEATRAAKRLRRIERHGSRKAKVLARRNLDKDVQSALAAVVAGMR